MQRLLRAVTLHVHQMIKCHFKARAHIINHMADMLICSIMGYACTTPENFLHQCLNCNKPGHGIAEFKEQRYPSSFLPMREKVIDKTLKLAPPMVVNTADRILIQMIIILMIVMKYIAGNHIGNRHSPNIQLIQWIQSWDQPDIHQRPAKKVNQSTSSQKGLE